VTLWKELGLELIDVEILKDHQFLAYFFLYIYLCRMHGRDGYRLDPATSIQELKYAVYRTLPALKSGAVFADCLKCQFSISFLGWLVCLTLTKNTFQKKLGLDTYGKR